MTERFEPQKGDKVSVCYDGKLGRSVPGEVIAKRGFAIKVRFDEWAGDAKGIEQWFVRTNNHAFGAFVKVEHSFMENLLGLPGDWYNVYPEEQL